MKKINNDGFILLETLVVAVFTVIVFTFIYTNSIYLIAQYDERKNYDDIDSVYAANQIRLMILNDGNYTTVVNKVTSDNSLIDITDCNQFTQVALCNTLKSQLEITKIYITKYELSKLKKNIEDETILNTANDRQLREYLLYVPKYTTASVSNGYRIFVQRSVEEDPEGTLKFGNIEMIK